MDKKTFIRCERINKYYGDDKKLVIGGYEGIPQNLTFNILAWMIGILIFSFIRKKAWNYGRLAYVSRAKVSWFSIVFQTHNNCKGQLATLADSSRLNSVPFENLLNTKSRCNKNDEGFFSWMRILLHLRDKEIQEKVGIDAVIFLRFYKYLIFYTGSTMLVCMIVILPINITGKYNSRQIQLFDITTITNISYNSNVLWVHLISGFCFFVFAVCLMSKFAHSLKEIHQKNPRIMDKTVMISNIPREGCKIDMLMNYFNRVYPGVEIMDVQLAYNVRELIRLDGELQSAIAAVEYCRYLDIFKGEELQMLPCLCGNMAMSFRSIFRFGCTCRRNESLQYNEDGLSHYKKDVPRMLRCCDCGCNKHTVDAMDFYTDLSSMLLHRIAEERRIAFTKPVGIAFITFGSPINALNFVRDHSHGCCGCWRGRKVHTSRRLLSHGWHVRFAPLASTFIWGNLTYWRRFYWAKIILLNIGVFTIALFLTTPLYVINLFTSNKIMQQLSVKYKLVFQIFPTIILWLTSALLPFLVVWTDRWSKHPTKSTKYFMTMIKTVAILLLMVLILPSLGFRSLAGIIFLKDKTNVDDDQHSITGESKTSFHWECIFMPDNSAYYVNYVITYCFIGSSFSLFRVSDLLRYCIRRSFLRSVAEISRADKIILYEFDFGLNYAYLLCLFCIITAYSVLCPIITPFGFLCLCMRFAVTRYNIYFSYLPSVTDSRLHWLATTFMLLGVIILQLNLFVFILIRRQFEASKLVSCSLILFVVSVVWFCLGISASWVYIDSNRRAGNKMYTLSDVVPIAEPFTLKKSSLSNIEFDVATRLKMPTFSINPNLHTLKYAANTNTNQLPYVVNLISGALSQMEGESGFPVERNSPTSSIFLV